MKKQQNNKGFSLIEILVVLVIMVVLVSGAVVAFTNWRAWNLNDCAKKIDTGLSAAKVEAMGRESGSLTIYRDDDDNYWMEVTGENPEMIGDKDIDIYYTDTDGNVDVHVTKTQKLILSYERATGGFKPIQTDPSGVKIFCSSIKITRKDLACQIRLARTTGKHSIVK